MKKITLFSTLLVLSLCLKRPTETVPSVPHIVDPILQIKTTMIVTIIMMMIIVITIDDNDNGFLWWGGNGDDDVGIMIMTIIVTTTMIIAVVMIMEKAMIAENTTKLKKVCIDQAYFCKSLN